MTLSKPIIEPPTGPAPTDLEIQDIIVGDGDEATSGHTVYVHYVGVTFSKGKEFDSSWKRNEPLDFRLGAGEVIQGWDRGVAGMRVGGRRKLVIPARLAYGDRRVGPIKAGEHLVFVVDLLRVR